MKILLVEDDQPTRAAIADALTSHHYSVSLADDGETGLELAEKFEYDLLVLDILIPKLDGINLCQRIRAKGLSYPILLLTAKDSTKDRVLGLDAGADDYLVKPFEMEELLARVRALLRRGKEVSSSQITWENICFDPMSKLVTCADRTLHLTPKEYCLLELFLLNPKRIYSRHAILDRLWDFAQSPGEQTVSTHIKSLRQKLKAAGASDPIETVYGSGYRLRNPARTPVNPKSTFPDSSRETSQNPQSNDAHKIEEAYRCLVSEKMAKIWEESKADFMAQLSVLEQAAQAFATDKMTAEMQQEAKHNAHKLAGSLGVFGLMKGSQLARELETLLLSSTILHSDLAEEFGNLVKLLQQEFQQPIQIGNKSEITQYTPLVLIVDNDLKLADLVRIEAIAWGLRVEVATSQADARQAIAKLSPDVILLDLNFPSSESGLILLQELIQRIPKIPVLAFTGRGTLTDRLEVARLGGCIFMEKPLPVQEILKAVTDVLSRNQIRHHNRVLAIDDDPIVLQQLSAILQPLGVNVTALEQPQRFWEVLTDVVPNLLILDLEMPEINGIELCQAVRSDPKWHDTPIVFLSSHAEMKAIYRAFAVGADDYISKSVINTELVNRVIGRLKRVGFQRD